MTVDLMLHCAYCVYHDENRKASRDSGGREGKSVGSDIAEGIGAGDSRLEVGGRESLRKRGRTDAHCNKLRFVIEFAQIVILGDLLRLPLIKTWSQLAIHV